MKRNVVTFRSNAKLARQLWGEPSRVALRGLRELTARHSLSVAAGDLQFLDGRWYVTHSGLLQLATPQRVSGNRDDPTGPALRSHGGSLGFQGYRL